MRPGSLAGVMLAALIATALSRPAAVGAQDVVPGATGEMVTSDLAPQHWAMDAVRRAEGLGLVTRPLPFRRAVSVAVVAEVLEEARVAARGRGEGLEVLTDGWRERFYQEFGGVAGGGEPGVVRLLSVRASGRAVVSDGRVAPGFGEVGPSRTGAVPLPDEAWAGVEGEVVAAIGNRFGLLIEPAVSTEGAELHRFDVVAGWDGWRIAVGRQPLGLAKGIASGLVLAGAVPLDRIEIRTERPAELPGYLGVLGPVGVQGFLSRIRDSDRHRREPYFWGGSLSVQPHPRVGLAVHRAAMFGGHGYDQPLTLQTLVNMLIGRVANLGFENQVVSVEARYRLPTEGWAPLTAYVEWGAEDAAGGLRDVPGRVFGIESPAIPGLEALSVGAAYTAIAEQCCGNSPWYRHGAFTGNWAAASTPLGHPLGGQGSEWLGYGAYDLPERGLLFDARLFRRDRDGQNLYVPGREESHGATLRGQWRQRPNLEFVAEGALESAREWTEHRLLLGANLFF